MRTPNADKLNASMRTGTRKRKITTTIVLSDSGDDENYQPAIAIESADDYDGKVEDLSDEDFVKPRSVKKSSGAKAKSDSVKRIKTSAKDAALDIEDALLDWRPHSGEYHNIDRIVDLKYELLQWFEGVRCVLYGLSIHSRHG